MAYQFGVLARAARESKQIPQEVLAAKIGMDRGYYSRLERGNPKNPGIGTREKIAAGLGMSLDEMIREATAWIETHPAQIDRITRVRVGNTFHETTEGSPVKRLQGLVQAVRWDADREAEVTARLVEYIKDDANNPPTP